MPQPTSFNNTPGESPLRDELFGVEQLTQHARGLAAGQVIAKGRHDKSLLERLNHNDATLRDFNEAMLIAKRPLHVAPAVVWLVDNFYLIEEHIQLARRHFPKKYSRELPCLSGGAFDGLPRVYGVVVELISHVDAQVDAEALSAFFTAYQSGAALTLGELWAVPIMLRLALIENLQRIVTRVRTNQRHREMADEWVTALQTVAAKRPSQLVEVVADMAKADVPLSSAFVAEFCQRLASQNPLLHMARSWLEQRLSEEGLSIEDLIHTEGQSQAANQVSVSHSIGSLRFLGATDWMIFVEAQSAVEAILRRDPAGVYGTMDFATRDRYRHEVERMARRGALSETEVARHAISLAEEAARAPIGASEVRERREAHVGFYLVDNGLATLVTTIGVKRSPRSVFSNWARRFPLVFHVGGVVLLSALGTAGFMQVMLARGAAFEDWKFIVLSLLFLLAVSQLAVSLVNWISMLLARPFLLPRIDFSKGIAPGSRTIVVVPSMLSNEKAVDNLLESVELHFLANRDELLHFALLTDFCDAPLETIETDAALLEQARVGIEDLNKRYSPERANLFYLFHRPRRWNPREGANGVWMGFERKRGKLLAFNSLLRGTGTGDDFSLIEGDTAILAEVKYVITLDSDTVLPRDAARKLAGTMAHPLNHPQFDEARNVVVRGYGILQPRVSASLLSSQRSIFARLFAGASGVDPYTRAVSDVYQDVFHEGSFVGKGIYDVAAMERVLSDRLPRNRILSHDLIESAYARSALVSDVELYENFPSGYNMDASRRHRWTRGDWQIARWIMPRVPVARTASRVMIGRDGDVAPSPRLRASDISQVRDEGVAAPTFPVTPRSERNPLSALARWKLFDNLRRSLVSPALLLFLVGYSFYFPTSGWLGPLWALVIVALPIVLALSLNAAFKSREQTWLMHLREVWQRARLEFEQVLFSLVLLPYDAFLCADAVVRTCWRLWISRRHLLEWRTSSDAEGSSRDSFGGFYAAMWFAPFFAIACGAALIIFRRDSEVELLPYALPALLAWLLAPAVAWRISRPIVPEEKVFSSEQVLLLRRIARKTWHFFETFVTARENWLPPDNFQEVPEPVIAARTSPTNIGLALLANLAAHDFGYLSAGGVVERTRLTFATMAVMKKYHGHFYNWYDTRSLEPLPPLYVSSVDSGNLAGHLLTLGQGLRELQDAPIFSARIFSGLLDTARALRSVAGNETAEAEETVETILKTSLATGLMPPTLPEAYELLRSLQEKIETMSLSFSGGAASLWTQTLRRECAAHLDELLTLAPCLKIAAPLESEHDDNTPATLRAIVAESLRAPTLRDVSRFEDTLCPLLENALANATAPNAADASSLTTWIDGLREASVNATARLKQLETLARHSDAFAQMDFTFLYDGAKKLFTIGYNVSEQRTDIAAYDLLASEARLCSYVAIAQGQVPQEHWFSLSRLLVVSEDEPVLLSWSGSMFEYLMPLLVMPSFRGTLLDHTCKAAVQEQIAYGKTLGVPWGISESGYNRTDAQMNYQYRAFGIPSLGLKRGLSEDLVIAPYATVMALMVAPRRACANMQRLSDENREGEYGYYEAVDYTPAHLRPDETSITISSYMAHHQGMSFLSLVNILCERPMQRRFINCPILKAAELLLQERISRNITANRISDDSKFELRGIHPLLPDQSEVTRIFKETTIAPEIHLLSNGRYHIMVSNAGGGYSRWRNIAVTRWREDATRDCWGLFVYLRDIDSGELWSATHQPTLRGTKNYEAIFTQAYAEFRQRHSGIEVHTGICVSPEDDIELRRITLRNNSQHARTLELTTYGEVLITPQAADDAHPAFSNLFVQTEFAPAGSTIFCTRRARSPEETPPHLLHFMLVPSDAAQDAPSCETDRARFIGRGQTLVNPLAMQTPGPLSNTSGAVLDPIIALRRTVTIPARAKVIVYVALGMAETRAAAGLLADKYQNARIAERAFELAWTHSQVTLHQLNATEAEAQLYGRLASALLYANPTRRAAPAILKSNRRGQSGLWSYSISGDVPLVLLRVNTLAGVGLVRQTVQAHAYWRMKGLAVELIIVNEDVSVYRQPLNDEIVNLISSGIEAPLLEKPGGIFVRRIEQIPREDLLLIQSTARLILDDTLGSLSTQLALRAPVETLVPLHVPTRMALHATQPKIPPRDIIFDNTLGGFTRDGREYIITLNAGQNTPAPWCNVIANEQFGTVISESGGTYTWAENAHEFRLTPWNNDPVQDTTGEAFYIRDEETGQYWSPTPLPARGATPYVIRHGFGYTVFEHTEYGIVSELWIYVAIDAPVKFAVLKLRNTSGRARRLSVTGYYEWVLADIRAKSLLHVQTEIDLKTGVLLARNYFSPGNTGQIAFLDVGEIRSVTADRKEFIGQNGTFAQPAAMKRARLSGKTGVGLDPCAAMQVTLDLADGQERETRFRLGCAADPQELQRLITRFQRPGAARSALEAVWEYWNRTLGTINLDTPDASVNMMANGWLLYQTLSSRVWGRSGYYQSGGAYGFRDQLQDVMALVHAEPATTRKQILRAAARQFREGDVQHWWHPPSGRGVRTHFSDDYLWLAHVTSRYIETVADTGILDEKIPYIDGRPLRSDEESYYDLPGHSEDSGTLYQHCVRSIEYGLKFGAHGLPLIGCGDWNDGMNLVGKHGKGESVWLAFFLYDVLMKFAPVASARGDAIFAKRCQDHARELQLNIEKNAWDGEWYRRAYFDDGTPLGSHTNDECRIDSLPQSWSIISRAGDPARSAQAMEQVNRQLIHRDAKLVQLFTPPFDKGALNPGYIKGYIPGVRENGGQYTHAAIWAAMAYAQLGETERAWELFRLLNPISHGSTAGQIATYKVEPYVVAADVYATAPHTGRGGWTWYTGSASWMYRLLVETLLGVNRAGDTLHLIPHLPKNWPSYKIHYRYNQTVYHITIARLGVNNDVSTAQSRLHVDGRELPDATQFPLINDMREHFVELWVK